MIWRRLRGSLGLSTAVAAAVAVIATVIAVAALAAVVDGAQLRAGISAGWADPAGLLLIGVALLGAFSLRAHAWSRLLPGLGFGQSLAAVHVALGANHVLPFRLGEPLRVLSAVRRSRVALAPATSSTVLLRSADIVTLILLGAVAGPGLLSERLRGWGPAIVAAVAVVGVLAAVSIARQRRLDRDGPERVRLPDLLTFAFVVGAWLAEAVVVWRVAEWFDISLGPQEAVAVLAAAVSIQLVAIAPGGVGTYEAAAAAALVATGVPTTTAVTAAVVLHAVKTLYSLIAGGIAVVAPQPSLLGRLRLARPAAHEPLVAAGPGPVVLFLPAHNEAPRVAPVIAAAPDEIDGRPVEVLVVDDGSTDDTVDVARAAGATVISHETNLGLGAAVRTGLRCATERGAAAVAFCDADGEYDPAQLADLVAPILAGRSHYVVGSRFRGEIGHMRLHRRLGNQVLTHWVRSVSRTPISDGQSGYRAFSAAAAARADVAHNYNYAQVLTIDLVAKGFGYHEVPITYAFRATGRSFVRLGTYLRHVVPTVWRQLNPTVDPSGHVPQPEEPPCTEPTSIDSAAPAGSALSPLP